MKTLLSLALGLGFSFSIAQSTLKKADEAFASTLYSDAIELYQKAYNGAKSSEKGKIAYQLAESYKWQNNNKLAAKWYEEAVNSGFSEKDVKLKLAEQLFITGDYTKAQSALESYKTAPTNQSTALAKSIAFAKEKTELKFDPSYIITNQKNVNTSSSNYGSVIIGDKLIYAGPNSSKIDKTSAIGFTDFFQANLNASTLELTSPNSINSEINTKYNEGAMVYLPKLQKVYYTQCNGKTGKESNCKIMVAGYNNGTFISPIDLGYKNPKHNVGHPAASSNDKVLLFASEMEGGKGGHDIWIIKNMGNNTWSTPINLSDKINTYSNEMFPYIAGDSVLFFASSGLAGFGGLDLFYVPIKISNSGDLELLGEPINLGAPFNSSYDDFGIAFLEGKPEGYFTSNREGGLGMDDIYSFKKKTANPKVTGTVKDNNNNPVAGATVKIICNGVEVATTTTDANGNYSLNAPDCDQFNVIANKESYTQDQQSASIPKMKKGFGFGEDFSKYNKDNTTNLTIAQKLFTVKGTVTDKNTKLPIPNANITVAGTPLTTNANGTYNYSGIKPSTKYEIGANKEAYLSDSKSFESNASQKEYVVDLELIPVSKEEIKINNIFYDLNKSSLRKESIAELDNLINILNKNTQYNIQINSHTDCRATDAYNEKLSQARAKSVVDYLISKGVASSRLQSKGWGESKLENQCADGVKCSEEEHQQNRRTTFNITNL
jgi:outer membrane protein OmpA-like peptidoglycan-associated protein